MKMLNMYYTNLKNNILSLKEELFEMLFLKEGLITYSEDINNDTLKVLVYLYQLILNYETEPIIVFNKLFEKFDINFNELQNIVSDYNYVIEKGNTNISVTNIKNIQTMLRDIQMNFSMLGYQEY
nr:MAG TPA: hypothetical protein [Caudoviricetes sp.]